MESNRIKQRVLVKVDAYHFDGALHNFLGKRPSESRQCRLEHFC